MATAKGNSNTLDELRESEKRVAHLKRLRNLECNHTSRGGVVLLKEYNGFVRNAEKYPENAVIHPDCGAIFDATAFTKDQVSETFFRLESMCQQIKMLTAESLSEKNKEDLIKMMEYIEYLQGNLGPYYNSMVEALTKDKAKQARSDRKFGGIGVSANLFS